VAEASASGAGATDRNTGEIARQPAAVRSRVVWVSCATPEGSPHTARSAGVAQPCLTAGQTEASALNWRGPLLAAGIFAAAFAILLLMAHQNQSTTSDMGSSLREDPYGTAVVRFLCTRRNKVKRSQDEDRCPTRTRIGQQRSLSEAPPIRVWAARGPIVMGSLR